MKAGNAYMTNDNRYPKPIKSSGSGSGHSGVGNLIGGAFNYNVDRSQVGDPSADESEGNINVSFQSHRNNSSNARTIAAHNFQAANSPVITDNSAKSFAAEMSKNK